MPIDIQSEEGQIIRRLIPLSTLPINQFESLCSKVTVEVADASSFLFKTSDTDSDLIYLIEGSITLQSSELKIETIQSGTESSRFALAHQIPRKIDALANTSVLLLLAFPGYNIGVYSVTFDLLKLVNITQICEVLDNLNLKYTLNKSDMIITVKNYGKIIFRSLDNPARIIGYEHAFALIDELDTLSKPKAEQAWNMVIARNRQKLPEGNRNKVGVFTTPEGYRFVYDRWEKNKQKGYLLLKARTVDNIYLPKEYVENLRATYPDNLIEAYLNGEFVNLNGSQVYISFNRYKCDKTIDYNFVPNVNIAVI